MTALLLAWLATASAAPTAGDLTVWSESAAEARPSLVDGDPYGTLAQRVGLDLQLDGGWQLRGDGGVRFRVPEVPYGARGDLWRAFLGHSGASHRVEVGRLVRLDARGFQRVDGASVLYRPAGPLQVSIWGGRLWTPTTWQPGDTFVGGVQAHLRPMVDGRPSRAFRATVGWEGRGGDLSFRSRLLGAASWHGPRGARVNGLVEGELGSDADTPVRAEVHAGGPVGRALDVSGHLAWQGLDHHGAPDSVSTPFDWMTQSGYGVGSLAFAWRHDGWVIEARGGATLQADGSYTPVPGGHARGSFGWRGPRWGLGAFANGARMGDSGLIGGGLDLDGRWERFQLDADTAWYRLEPLDGSATLVWEARARGAVVLASARRGDIRHHVDLALDAATGTDRQLSPRVRAGLALRIRLTRALGGAR